MKKEYFNEKNGLWYDLGEDDIYYPRIKLNNKKHKPIGKYGMLRKHFLMQYHSALFSHLLLSETLNEHLYEINTKAQAMVDKLVEEMAKNEGCNSELKMREQMKWVGLMNNYHACAEEIVLREVVYN